MAMIMNARFHGRPSHTHRNDSVIAQFDTAQEAFHNISQKEQRGTNGFPSPWGPAGVLDPTVPAAQTNGPFGTTIFQTHGNLGWEGLDHGYSNDFFITPSYSDHVNTAPDEKVLSPDDMSPKTPLQQSTWEATSSHQDDSEQSTESSEEDTKTRQKTPAGSKASKGDSTNRRKPPREQQREQRPNGEESAKRARFLERNRAAAHRCRQKKKEWAVQLDEKCRDLKARNLALEAHAAQLCEEAYQLKSMLLQHSDCNFAPIQSYITETAESLGSRTSEVSAGSRRSSVK